MQSPRTDWLNTKALTITHVFYPVSQLIYHREREEGWQAERPRAFIHCGNQTCALHSDLRFAYTAEANQPGAQSIYPLCIIICAWGTAAHSHRVALSCWVSERERASVRCATPISQRSAALHADLAERWRVTARTQPWCFNFCMSSGETVQWVELNGPTDWLRQTRGKRVWWNRAEIWLHTRQQVLIGARFVSWTG